MRNLYLVPMLAGLLSWGVHPAWADGMAGPARNHGLDKPQDPATLPVGKAQPQVPQRVAKLAARPEVVPEANGDLVLNRGWEMIEAPNIQAPPDEISAPGFDTSKWYDATVPGTVLTTLVQQGVYPDPYYGLNNLAIPDTLCRQDYWYREQFTLPASDAGRRITLTFAGINYHAEVWLNGTRCGEIRGAFMRGIFDVTASAKVGAANVLLVKISPPPHPGIPHEQSIVAGEGPNGGAMCQDGPTFFATEGWDWIPGIRDRDTGIWQDVTVHASGAVMIGDPLVITHFPPATETATNKTPSDPKRPAYDLTHALLTVRSEVRNLSDQPQQATLAGMIEGVKFEQPVQLQPGETKTVTFEAHDYPQLTIDHPRLWWPNGYGKPELYDLNLKVTGSQGESSDEKTVRFGVRTVTVELAPDLTLRVNGRRIFCRGGSWGMDDAMKNVGKAHLEPYVRLHRDANQNIIRFWCGQSCEESLYELCDQYGILVWNEFWLSTAGWNMVPTDNALYLANARDTISHYRIHPSIVIWGGRNEGTPPRALDAGVANLVKELDPYSYYQPSSTQTNLQGSGPWDLHPAAFYYGLSKGFKTELGMPSIPSIECLKSFIPPEDLWPISDTWAYHDYAKGASGPASWSKAVANFGDPKDAADFCRKSQLLNYAGYRSMFEAWNAHLFHSTSGLMIWMTHPAWPSTVWQLYTFDYEPTAAFFGAEKACEPVHVQLNLNDNSVSVINTTDQPLENVKVSLKFYGLDGQAAGGQDATLTAKPEAATVALHAPWPAQGSKVWFAKVELHDTGGQLLSDNFYWHAAKEPDLAALNDLPSAPVTVTVKPTDAKDETGMAAEVTNSSGGVALMVKLSLRDRNDQRVLPSYYSDNYLSLLPGETRHIVIECPKAAIAAGLQLDVDGYNVPEQKIAIAP